MPRIQPILKREELAPEHQWVYDGIFESRGGVGGPFGVLLHNPPIADLVAKLGAQIRFQSHLPPAEEELAIIAVAREANCHVEWSGHVRLARRNGVREEAIDSLRNRQAPQGLTEEESVVVRYVHELMRTRKVSAPVYAAALARFGVPTLMELTTLIGYYTMLAGVLNAFEVVPPPDAEPLPL